MSRRNSFALKSFALTVIAFFVLSGSFSSLNAAEPNDTLDDATLLAAGTWTVTDTIEGGGLAPDTYLGFFADNTFPLPALEIDDDSSPLGDGLADALIGISVNTDGSIPLIVTGCCNADFDGSHSEEGDYELYVDVFDATGTLIDSFNILETLEDGAVDEHPFIDTAWIGGTFDALIDNTVGFGIAPDPIDYWIFTGLPAGETFQAETTTGDFDTIIGLLDPDGTIIDTDDDSSGVDNLSLLTGIVPANGEVILAVTGYSDFDLEGFHSELGSYELTVTIVPEPTTLALLLVGLATFLGDPRHRS